MSTTDLLCEFLKNTNISSLLWRYYINEFMPGWSMQDYHNHEAYEIIYCTCGEGFIKLKDDLVKINKNDCIVIFSNKSHKFYVEENNKCTLLNIHFNINKRETILFNTDTLNKKVYAKFNNNSEIKYIMNEIVREMDNKKDNYDVLVKMYFFQLFIFLSRIFDEKRIKEKKVSNTYVDNALEFIHENYNMKLSPKIISKAVHISSDYLLHIFKEHTGQSVMEYITIKRIDKSKELLQNTSKTISTIAHDLGFSNSQYFSTLFKKYIEMTPNQFRKISKLSNNSDSNIFK
ncbi:hypothetical protein SH2C18_44490 [Clostridium sediminicola]|uniref:helix-turn-helix domain-containing protein n=1 Tax=Clostridium sediminicola TaxID=3114879 RepID=UPI0031F1F94B